MVAAIIAWLVTSAAVEGGTNVDNLGQDYPMLAGNVAALGISMIVTAVLCYAHPQNFDWETMRTGIHMIELDGTEKLADAGEDSQGGLRTALECVPFPSWKCVVQRILGIAKEHSVESGDKLSIWKSGGTTPDTAPTPCPHSSAQDSSQVGFPLLSSLFACGLCSCPRPPERCYKLKTV
jgi:hypothetical protein